jgi:hypothetical protein
MSEEGKLQNYSVDQVAGAFVLCMGAIASLLLVVWQSKCHCKCNLCYLFQCERRPPPDDIERPTDDAAEPADDAAEPDVPAADDDEPLVPPAGDNP